MAALLPLPSTFGPSEPTDSADWFEYLRTKPYPSLETNDVTPAWGHGARATFLPMAEPIASGPHVAATPHWRSWISEDLWVQVRSMNDRVMASGLRCSRGSSVAEIKEHIQKRCGEHLPFQLILDGRLLKDDQKLTPETDRLTVNLWRRRAPRSANPMDVQLLVAHEAELPSQSSQAPQGCPLSDSRDRTSTSGDTMLWTPTFQNPIARRLSAEADTSSAPSALSSLVPEKFPKPLACPPSPREASPIPNATVPSRASSSVVYRSTNSSSGSNSNDVLRRGTIGVGWSATTDTTTVDARLESLVLRNCGLPIATATPPVATTWHSNAASQRCLLPSFSVPLVPQAQQTQHVRSACIQHPRGWHGNSIAPMAFSPPPVSVLVASHVHRQMSAPVLRSSRPLCFTSRRPEEGGGSSPHVVTRLLGRPPEQGRACVHVVTRSVSPPRDQIGGSVSSVRVAARSASPSPASKGGSPRARSASPHALASSPGVPHRRVRSPVRMRSMGDVCVRDQFINMIPQAPPVVGVSPAFLAQQASSPPRRMRSTGTMQAMETPGGVPISRPVSPLVAGSSSTSVLYQQMCPPKPSEPARPRGQSVESVANDGYCFDPNASLDGTWDMGNGDTAQIQGSTLVLGGKELEVHACIPRVRVENGGRTMEGEVRFDGRLHWTSGRFWTRISAQQKAKESRNRKLQSAIDHYLDIVKPGQDDTGGGRSQPQRQREQRKRATSKKRTHSAFRRAVMMTHTSRRPQVCQTYGPRSHARARDSTMCEHPPFLECLGLSRVYEGLAT